MDLIPVEIGPLNPQVQDLVVAGFLFAVCYLCMVPLLRRAHRVMEAREQATDGVGKHAEEVRALAAEKREEAHVVLAEARHEAARIRQQAEAEGAALIAEARADGVRERDALLARATTRIETDRATAEAELRTHIPVLATELASRVLGEPVSPGTRTPAADTR
jgi:F-type H+-transporting ATPase subunit b